MNSRRRAGARVPEPWRRLRQDGPSAARGVAAVELVIILPLALTLVMGTLAMGTAYYLQLNLTEGAREGARVGATLRVGYNPGGPENRSGTPTDEWLQEVAAVATSTAGDWETVCVSYTGRIAFRPTGSTVTRTLRQANGGAPSYSTDTCFTDGRPANERRVQVAVTDTGPFDNFFSFRSTLNLEGTAVARFERPYTAVG
jgi:hypothetical protein